MTDINELLAQGIAALKSGQKAKARDLLEQIIQQDEHNELAWLWLSGAVNTNEERRACLENVLTINPNNSVAKRGLDAIIASSQTESPQATSQTPKPSLSVSQPATMPKIESQVISSPKTKPCPFCAEEIQEAAIVCKHCGRGLITPTALQTEASTPTKSKSVKQKQKKWYMATGIKILAFIFFTPLWTLIVLDDPDSTTGVKILATILLVFYMGLCCFLSYGILVSGRGY